MNSDTVAKTSKFDKVVYRSMIFTSVNEIPKKWVCSAYYNSNIIPGRYEEVGNVKWDHIFQRFIFKTSGFCDKLDIVHLKCIIRFSKRVNRNHKKLSDYKGIM